MIVTFYPPKDLKITPKKLSEYLEGFKWNDLPREFTRNYMTKPRRIASFQLDKIDRLELADHCDFYGKSFTSAIMQALTSLELYK